MCVFWVFFATFSETFLILGRTVRDITNVHRSLCKIPVALVIFSLDLKFLELISNVMKICLVGDEFHADGRKDTGNQTDMTKLIVTSRTFAKRLKTGIDC